MPGYALCPAFHVLNHLPDFGERRRYEAVLVAVLRAHVIALHDAVAENVKLSSFVRLPQGEDLVEDDSQRIDVAAAIDLFEMSLDLLG